MPQLPVVVWIWYGPRLSATGSSMRLNQLKLTRPKKWCSVEQLRSARFGARCTRSGSLCAEAGTRAAAPFPAPLSPLWATSFAALRTGFS